MSFGWLGTFRQGQWQAYRRFVLEERRDVIERIRVIEAELARIGEVTVIYAETEDDDENVVITEERVGFQVTEGSTLGKLLQAYVALGGNPFDISLFLTPDTTVTIDNNDPDQKGRPQQPYNGVIYPKSGSYATGGIYEGGFLVLKKYVPARVGGRKDIEDSRVAGRVDRGRRWVNKEIRYKRNDLEARILKQVDLREQLIHELQDITMAIAGMTGSDPDLDEDRYDKELSVAGIVAAIDRIFYITDEDGTPDFEQENSEELGKYIHLMSDLSPEEDNTAL
jgi:hypothetical protein